MSEASSTSLPSLAEDLPYEFSNCLVASRTDRRDTVLFVWKLVG